MEPDGPPEVVVKPSADCQHEGSGKCCYKCGEEYQVDKYAGRGGCGGAQTHLHMRDTLKRSFCTFCGLDLSTITVKEI